MKWAGGREKRPPAHLCASWSGDLPGRLRGRCGALRPENARLAPLGSQNGHKPAQPKFKLLTDVEAENMPPAQGILGDLLFEESIAFPVRALRAVEVLCGAGLGALHRRWGPLAGACGEAWAGGLVVYVTAEGARSFGKRISAWKHHNDVQGQTDLYVLPEAVHLL